MPIHSKSKRGEARGRPSSVIDLMHSLGVRMSGGSGVPPATQIQRPSMSSSSSAAAAKTVSFPIAVRVLIKGRVQGVFYRNWTVDNARELGLKGWVRNRKDGSVEAVFSGDPKSVEVMESRCRRGPPAALVTGLEVSPSNEDPGPSFDCKPTL
ncbi:hypothetical protein ACLOJK_000805 [Asimina triloba]